MASSGADASSSPNDEDCNLAQDGSGSAENEPILFHGSVSNNGGSGNPMESSGGGGSGDDGDEDGCISKVEDSLVRMDLTDDLLHMVCLQLAKSFPCTWSYLYTLIAFELKEMRFSFGFVGFLILESYRPVSSC